MLDERVEKLHWPIQFPSAGFYTNRKFIGRAVWDGNFIDIVQSTLYATFRQLIVSLQEKYLLVIATIFSWLFVLLHKGCIDLGECFKSVCRRFKGEKTWGFKVTFLLCDVEGRQRWCLWLKHRRWWQRREKSLLKNRSSSCCASVGWYDTISRARNDS